jgi:hypothetical protein
MSDHDHKRPPVRYRPWSWGVRSGALPRATASKPLAAGGLSLLLAGAVCLLLSLYRNTGGQVPAVGLLFLFEGLVFLFPTVLTDGTDQVSAMRTVVLLTCAAFSLVIIKHSWENSAFTMDPSWKYILGAAFAGKAVQSLGESFDPTSGPQSARPKLGSADFRPPGES